MEYESRLCVIKHLNLVVQVVAEQLDDFAAIGEYQIGGATKVTLDVGGNLGDGIGRRGRRLFAQRALCGVHRGTRVVVSDRGGRIRQVRFVPRTDLRLRGEASPMRASHKADRIGLAVEVSSTSVTESGASALRNTLAP